MSVSANATSDDQGWTSVPVAKDGEKGPYERGLKAKFGYDDRKGVGARIADPPGWEKTTRYEAADGAHEMRRLSAKQL